MTTRADIERVLALLPEGVEVRLKLKDGSEIVGVVEGVDEKAVQLGQSNGAIDLDRVETVLLDEPDHGGPE